MSTTLNELPYDSPRPSVDTTKSATPHVQEQPPPKPSIRLLFSLLSRPLLLFLLLPAVFASVIAGGVAPFMTYVIGQAFDVFAQFPLTHPPPKQAKERLLHGVGLAAIELVALAVGSLVLSSLTSCLWIWIGESNAMAVRKRVYLALMRKEMSWFDTKLGSDDAIQSANDGPIGAGGLMATFAR